MRNIAFLFFIFTIVACNSDFEKLSENQNELPPHNYKLTYLTEDTIVSSNNIVNNSSEYRNNFLWVYDDHLYKASILNKSKNLYSIESDIFLYKFDFKVNKWLLLDTIGSYTNTYAMINPNSLLFLNDSVTTGNIHCVEDIAFFSPPKKIDSKSVSHCNIYFAMSKDTTLLAFTNNQIREINPNSETIIPSNILPFGVGNYKALAKEDTILICSDDSAYISYDNGRFFRPHIFSYDGMILSPAQIVFDNFTSMLFYSNYLDSTLYYSQNFGINWVKIDIGDSPNFYNINLLNGKIVALQYANNETRLFHADTDNSSRYKFNMLPIGDYAPQFFIPFKESIIVYYMKSEEKKEKNVTTTTFYYKYYLANEMPHYSIAEQYKVIEGLDSITILVRIRKEKDAPFFPNFRVQGSRDSSMLKNILLDTKVASNDSTLWSLKFPKNALANNDKLTTGTNYYLVLYFADNLLSQVFPLGKREYQPYRNIRNVFIQYPLLYSILIVLFLVSTLLLVFFISPLSIFVIYKNGKQVFAFLDTLPKVVSEPMKWLAAVSLIPYLATRDKVLNAWIKENYILINNAFYKNDTVNSKHTYVSLPVSTFINGAFEELTSPDAVLAEQWIMETEAGIEIIGIGGSGKTTLAIQLAKWIIGSSKNIKYIAPVLIEKDNVTNLIKEVKETLQGITRTELPDEFIKTLLVKRYILVIIDALTEKNEAMQAYINDIYRTREVGDALLIVTARRHTLWNDNNKIRLEPSSLDPDHLLMFIQQTLNGLLKNAKEDLAIMFNDTFKATIAERIKGIYTDLREDGNPKIVITPLLISLLIRNSIDFVVSTSKDSQINFEELAKKLPVNMPDVYRDYMLRHKLANTYKPEAILYVSQLLAFASLIENDTYVPQLISKNKLLRTINEKAQYDIEVSNLIDDMVKAGLLLEVLQGMELFIKFQLDPLSEFLAAAHIYRENFDNTKSLLKKLKSKESPPQGFIDALEITIKSYTHKVS